MHSPLADIMADKACTTHLPDRHLLAAQVRTLHAKHMGRKGIRRPHRQLSYMIETQAMTGVIG